MGGVEVELHSFVTLTLVGSEWSALRPPAVLPQGMQPSVPVENWLPPETAWIFWEKSKNCNHW